MASPTRPANAPGAPKGDPSTDFTRLLRFEWADQESRALVWSYVVSITLAVIWLIIVNLYNVPRPTLLPQNEQVSINLSPALDKAAPPPPVAPQQGPATQVAAAGPTTKPAGKVGPKGNPTPGRPGSRTETFSTGAISNAFGTGSGSGTGGLVGDVSGILRGVAVASGSGGTGGGQGGRGGGGSGGKTVLGYGQGGQGGVTPGRGGFGGGTGTGGGGGGGGIGGVGSGGGIVRATVRVAPPRPMQVDNLGGPTRDVGALGDFVRGRESQLRFCYVEFGLKSNPALAGTITVAITITASGSVSGVDIANRTWGGAGSSETESCIQQKIRSWVFPASSSGGGTYSFPFNFTK